MNDDNVIHMPVDERDRMQAALHRMRDAFVTACQSGVPWETAGELQHEFFDGYEQAKKTWGDALFLRDVVGKGQEHIRDEEHHVFDS